MYNTIKWHNNQIKLNKKPISKKNLVNYLWENLEIKGDVKVRDLFEVVRSNLNIWNVVLQEWALNDIVKEYMKVRRKKAKNPWVSSVVFCKYVEILKHDKYEFTMFGKKRIAQPCHDFTLSIDVAGKKRGCKCYRGISMVDLEEILDAKICIETMVQLTRSSRNKNETEEAGNFYPTVLEIFKAFFYEITFYGNPEDRRKISCNLDKQVKDIKSGKSKLYDFKTGEEVKSSDK